LLVTVPVTDAAYAKVLESNSERTEKRRNALTCLKFIGVL